MTAFDFQWDGNKARTNLAKHGVSFRLATAVFRDPLALTIFDEEHSDEAGPWVTLAQAQNGRVLVLAHTSDDVSSRNCTSASFRRAAPIRRKCSTTNRHRASGQR